MNVCPATVIVPERGAGVSCGVAPVFAATLKLTVPLPVPDPPPVTVIQLAFDAALHAQFDPLVTLMLPLPPLFATVWLVGEIE